MKIFSTVAGHVRVVLSIMPFTSDLNKKAFKNFSSNCFVFCRNFGWNRVSIRNLVDSELVFISQVVKGKSVISDAMGVFALNTLT